MIESKKGGKREGSGRKRLDKIKICLSLNQQSIDFLNKQKNKSGTVDCALFILQNMEKNKAP